MKTKFKIFDRGIGHFLQPEINGIPFIVSQDGDAYTLELKHPDFVMCEYAGQDRAKRNLYEGDIVQVHNSQGVITNRNIIVKDHLSGEFYVQDLAPGPGPCRVPMTSVRLFYDLVGNMWDKSGPQTVIFEAIALEN
jgi:hypothetical protein